MIGMRSHNHQTPGYVDDTDNSCLGCPAQPISLLVFLPGSLIVFQVTRDTSTSNLSLPRTNAASAIQASEDTLLADRTLPGRRPLPGSVALQEQL